MNTKLKVAEVFYSLQGEGYRAGEPSVFVRLSGCDLSCGFCDTEFESGKVFSVEELVDEINKAVLRTTGGKGVNITPWIVWTGGEPSLQLTPDIVTRFHALGFKQAIETNGNNPVPSGLDWVACSPKVADHVLAKNFPDGVDELRYVRHAGQPSVPNPSIKARCHYLSPMFNGDQPNKENLQHCIKLCLENPAWSLSIQSHKLHRIL